MTAGGTPCFCAFGAIAHVWLGRSSDSEVSVLAGFWQGAGIKKEGMLLQAETAGNLHMKRLLGS